MFAWFFWMDPLFDEVCVIKLAESVSACSVESPEGDVVISDIPRFWCPLAMRGSRPV
jgi:hypothetical protein